MKLTNTAFLQSSRKLRVLEQEPGSSEAVYCRREPSNPFHWRNFSKSTGIGDRSDRELATETAQIDARTTEIVVSVKELCQASDQRGHSHESQLAMTQCGIRRQDGRKQCTPLLKQREISTIIFSLITLTRSEKGGCLHATTAHAAALKRDRGFFIFSGDALDAFGESALVKA